MLTRVKAIMIVDDEELEYECLVNTNLIDLIVIGQDNKTLFVFMGCNKDSRLEITDPPSIDRLLELEKTL